MCIAQLCSVLSCFDCTDCNWFSLAPLNNQLKLIEDHCFFSSGPFKVPILTTDFKPRPWSWKCALFLHKLTSMAELDVACVMDVLRFEDLVAAVPANSGKLSWSIYVTLWVIQPTPSSTHFYMFMCILLSVSSNNFFQIVFSHWTILVKFHKS